MIPAGKAAGSRPKRGGTQLGGGSRSLVAQARLGGGRIAAVTPHLRDIEAEPDRPRQGLPAVQPSRLAVHTPPFPGRPRFRPSRLGRPPGTGDGAPRSGAPSRAARRRLGPRVLGLRIQGDDGCTAGPGGGWLGLVRRWTRSPGNGASYGAPQWPNHAASLRACTPTETACSPFLYCLSAGDLIVPPLRSTTCLLETLTCSKTAVFQFLPRPPFSGRFLHILMRLCRALGISWRPPMRPLLRGRQS